MFHGRDLFTGPRNLWRVWAWSAECSPQALEFAASMANAS